jgi:hypothetical protein
MPKQKMRTENRSASRIPKSTFYLAAADKMHDLYLVGILYFDIFPVDTADDFAV